MDLAARARGSPAADKPALKLLAGSDGRVTLHDNPDGGRYVAALTLLVDNEGAVAVTARHYDVRAWTNKGADGSERSAHPTSPVDIAADRVTPVPVTVPVPHPASTRSRSRSS